MLKKNVNGHVVQEPFIFQRALHAAVAHRACLTHREENRTQFVEALASLFFPGADKADGKCLQPELSKLVSNGALFVRVHQHLIFARLGLFT